MNFSGFDEHDYELFSIPDFAGRMAAIRTRVRPHLLALGEDLGERVEEVLGSPVFPHVAQHMRRRVNPPVETWVAFARDRKGYKRWTHYRVVLGEDGVRVTLFVEDDADDKPAFGAALAGLGEGILQLIGDQAPLQWYTLAEAGAVPHAQVTPATLRQEGERLQRLKTRKFQAGVPLTRREALRMKPAAFEAWVLEQVRLLKPLYLSGTDPGFRP
jgi:uncharacterized protein YktB (UPF0637 family)